jgi:hypothetical protein
MFVNNKITDKTMNSLSKLLKLQSIKFKGYDQGDQTSRIVRDSPTLEGFVPQHASPQCGTHFSGIPEIFQTFNK